MQWASFEKSLVAALWLSAVGCACAAFNTRRIDMGSATDSDAASAHQSYANAGPFRTASRRNIRLQGTVPSQRGSAAESEGSTKNFTVHLTVTRPIGGGDAARQSPFPVVFFFNGFQLRSSFYRAYATRLASWGFVCVQYDDPLLAIIDDATELQYFDPLMAWLRKEDAASSGFLHGALDLDNLAVAGHSRGGKLAALLYAERPDVKAAFLVDPVDSTSHTRESSHYPSAVKALRAANKPFGMLGAGITGRCNPEGSNYKDFFGVAATGSWQAIVRGAGHTQFLTAEQHTVLPTGRLLDPALRLLCGGGSSSTKQVQSLALPVVVAWMEQQFRPAPDLQLEFRQWIEQQVSSDKIAFTARGPGSASSQPISASEQHAAEAVMQKGRKELPVA